MKCISVVIEILIQRVFMKFISIIEYYWNFFHLYHLELKILFKETRFNTILTNNLLSHIFLKKKLSHIFLNYFNKKTPQNHHCFNAFLRCFNVS